MIHIKDVSFSYGEGKVDVLKDINLVVKKGEFIVLTGVSGSGKTSVTKLINGIISEFEKGNLRGEVIVNGLNTKEAYVSDISHSVGSVFQDPNAQFFTTDVCSELVFPCENIGMEKEKIQARLDDISVEMELLHLLHKELFELSGGQKQRVAVASVCMNQPKIIVLDEPSSNLDGQSITKLKEVLWKLKEEGYTIVISEHRIHYLMELCDSVVYMKAGSIEKIYSREEFASLSNSQLNALGLRSRDLKSAHFKSKNEYANNPNTTKVTNLEIKDLSYSYDNGIPVLKDLSMSLKKGDVVAILGENGAGKSTLMEVLCGLRRNSSGSIHIENQYTGLKARQMKSYLVMQVPEYQLFTESVEAELKVSGVSVDDCKEKLDKLGLDTLLDKHPASISGGQKQRLCILLATLKDANTICFDEPTSGLDYGNMLEVASVIEELSSQGKTILIVTHDYEFIMNCCNKAIFMTKDSQCKTLDVNKRNKERIYAYMEQNVSNKVEKSNIKPMQMLFEFMKPCLGKQIWAIIFAIISVVGAIIPYIATFNIFQLFFNGNQTREGITYWSVVALVGFIVKALGHAISTNLAHICAFEILRNMRVHIGDKLMNISLGTTQSKSIGKLKNMIVDQVEKIELELAHVIPEGTAAVLLPIAIFIYMLSLDYRLALASFITLPISMIPFVFVFKDYSANYDNYMKSNDYMNSTIVEYVEGIEVVKAFSQTDKSYGKFADAVNSFKDTTMEWFRTTRVPLSIMTVLMPTTTLCVLPIGVHLYISEGLDPAIVLTCVLLSMGLVSNFSKITIFANDVKSVQYAIAAVCEEMQDEEMVQGTRDDEVTCHNISFRDVSFSYSNSMADAVIKDMCLEIEEGKFYALVGPSGSGKSTLAKLMARFWDVSQGEITIGGVGLKEMSLKKLGEMVSFVTQDNFLFNVSVFENIKVGNPNASDEQVYAAAKMAMCDEFIGKLEHGYQSTAGEAGAKLSGGERQRISIARAILKDAPIVILDEATAFTDPQNERQIQESIRALTKDKTLIVIAHRLSTIKNADEIIVLKDGCVEAKGNHDNLVQECELYRTMWDMHENAKEWGVSNV